MIIVISNNNENSSKKITRETIRYTGNRDTRCYSQVSIKLQWE